MKVCNCCGFPTAHYKTHQGLNYCPLCFDALFPNQPDENDEEEPVQTWCEEHGVPRDSDGLCHYCQSEPQGDGPDD